MVDQVTFRTTDSLRWGPGQLSDLTATEIDINFWVLLTAVQALQTQANDHAGIDHFVVVGTNLFVHLTNHFVLGPYLLPTAQWNFRNAWTPRTAYQAFDVFTNAGSVYLVLTQHVSNSLFDPGSTDHSVPPNKFYALLLAAPPPELPQTGDKGAFLQWQNSPGDVRWFPLARNIAIYCEATPDPVEVIADYVFTESTTFPIGLTGSQFSVGTRPTGDQEFELMQDGGPIGHVTIHHTGPATVVFNHAITFTAGEILSVIAPTVPDAHMTRVRFNLVGTLD
jgi:hypothetical protein